MREKGNDCPPLQWSQAAGKPPTDTGVPSGVRSGDYISKSSGLHDDYITLQLYLSLLKGTDKV